MPSFSLRLTVIACHGTALGSGASAVFNASGGTIGRDGSNTLVLPDDDGTVARRHAAIQALADGWQLRNTSEHAAIALNGKILAPGLQAVLQAGDFVNIGAYVLQSAASAAPPLANSPTHAGPIAIEETCAPAAVLKSSPGSALGSPLMAAGPNLPHNPLHMTALPAVHLSDPLSGVGPSAGLHELLNTPLDPLALFGVPQRAASSSSWNDPGWNDPAAGGLFADLVAQPAHGSFETQRPNNLPGHAIRDDVPEFDGHLRLKIAPPPDRSIAEPTSSHDSGNNHGDYRDPFGERHDTLTSTVRNPVPDYSGKLHTKGTLRNDAPIRLRESSAPGVSPAPSADAAEAPSASPAVLVQAFLDGAGVAPDTVACSGLTPEFMHTLGTLVRALQRQIT